MQQRPRDLELPLERVRDVGLGYQVEVALVAAVVLVRVGPSVAHDLPLLGGNVQLTANFVPAGPIAQALSVTDLRDRSAPFPSAHPTVAPHPG